MDDKPRTHSDKISFLTDQQIEKNQLKENLLQNMSKISDNDEKSILKEILSNFDNFCDSLSQQEIYFLKSHDSSTWLNYLIFRFQFKTYPKKQILPKFPLYLLIEPVSACNLRCIMCFQIDETFSKNQEFMGMMKFDLFKKIIDQAYANGTKAITLASRGEPTLHPQLGEMLDYCSGKFFEIKINTNATKLNEKLIHKILQSGVTDVVFSVDSYSKEEYESIRVKGIFENVLNNIKKFKEIKSEYPNSICATRISGVKVTKEQDPIKFKEFWKEYVDHVAIVEMDNRWDTYHNPKEIAGTIPCEYLWERMYIWYDGKCNPCDIDYKSELEVGNVTTHSLNEIWNSSKYAELRKFHSSGQRSSCFPCDRCPYGS